MTTADIDQYSASVRNCLDVLDKARPSEGIRDCSQDCRDAAEQIQTSPAPRDSGQPG